MAACSMYVKDAQGITFIAASQRPDGTWRKSRRVKDGYVPQEEVPLYESKGKQFVKNKPLYPPGYTPDVKEAKTKKPGASPIPGLVLDETEGKTNRKKKKKQNDSINNVAEHLNGIHITPAPAVNSSAAANSSSGIQVEAVTNPEKRVKNLRKRLREIELIQERIDSGQLKNPEKDQMEKIARKSLVESEIKELVTCMSTM